MRSILSLLALSAAGITAQNLGLFEPPDGQWLLGMWLDVSHEGDYDSPAALNARLGLNASNFQYSQDIPLTPFNWTTGAYGPANITSLIQSGTDAAFFLTVYPRDLNAVDDQSMRDLGTQLATYANSRIKVFLRFAPEFNGPWMPYGMQPTLFVSTWRRLHTIVKSMAPATAMVWAPNTDIGYPFGAAIPADANGSTDGFAPYYPGDDYVDWNMISFYWKGPTYPYFDNVVQPAGLIDGAMTGSQLGRQFQPFYSTYCQTKPCGFAEAGAAFHINATAATPTQFDLQKAWIDAGLANRTFWDSYPKMKLANCFEHMKFEDGLDLRDFRITTDPEVREYLISALKSSGMFDRLQQAPANLTQIEVQASSSAASVAAVAATAKDTSGPPPSRFTKPATPNLFSSDHNSNSGASALSLSVVSLATLLSLAWLQ